MSNTTCLIAVCKGGQLSAASFDHGSTWRYKELDPNLSWQSIGADVDGKSIFSQKDSFNKYSDIVYTCSDSETWRESVLPGDEPVECILITTPTSNSYWISYDGVNFAPFTTGVTYYQVCRARATVGTEIWGIWGVWDGVSPVGGISVDFSKFTGYIHEYYFAINLSRRVVASAAVNTAGWLKRTIKIYPLAVVTTIVNTITEFFW